MKKKLIVSVALMGLLFSCRTKYVYVDRPANTPAPAASMPSQPGTDDKPYQTQPGDYSPAPVQSSPPASNSSTQTYNPQQNNYPPNNSGQQQYNNNTGNSDQYYSQESDQDYYSHQQHVSYGGNSSYQVFYDELAPYGSWVDYPGYGYVWVPAQGPGFRPYVTNGYWAYSDYGWTWVSAYNWGWAPFHYGNWLMDPAYGWVWVPGHTWAPAWVTWGQCNGYYGWAPIAPRVNYYEGYRPPVHYWNFVPEGQVTSQRVSNYVVNHTNNSTIINNNTTNIVVINNQVMHDNAKYNAGPDVNKVERATGHKVQPVSFSESSKPVAANTAVNAGRIAIYKPAIDPAATKTAPAAVVPLQSVKTINSAAVKGVLPRTTPSQANPDIRRSEPARNPSAIDPQRPGNSNPGRPGEPQRDPSRVLPNGSPERRPAQDRSIDRAPQESPAQERPLERQPVQRQPEQRPIERAPQQNPVQERPIERQPVQRQPEQRQTEQRPIERQPIQRQPEQRAAPQPIQRPATPQPRPAAPRPASRPQPASKDPGKPHL